MDTDSIVLQTRNRKKISLKKCTTFGCKLKGLMFSKGLKVNEGLIFVGKMDTRINAGIHMLFMNYDIAVVWINSSFRIVDKQLAKKWHLSYIPSQPAMYTLEIHPMMIDEFSVGELVSFDKT
jgi:hypothetical protein